MIPPETPLPFQGSCYYGTMYGETVPAVAFYQPDSRSLILFVDEPIRGEVQPKVYEVPGVDESSVKDHLQAVGFVEKTG